MIMSIIHYDYVVVIKNQNLYNMNWIYYLLSIWFVFGTATIVITIRHE